MTGWGRVIHWELCKWLIFDHSDKWNMHKLEYIRENETHTILWGFQIQTDLLIPVRRPDIILIKKTTTFHLVDIAISVDQRVKTKESEKIDKHIDLASEPYMHKPENETQKILLEFEIQTDHTEKYS